MAWLWRRRFCNNSDLQKSTPRRLIYLLPSDASASMLYETIHAMLQTAGIRCDGKPGGLGIQCIQPGKRTSTNGYREWYTYPEMDQMIFGTADFLISGALNRGYGVASTRWSMQFAMLNNDALWILDELNLWSRNLSSASAMEDFRWIYKTYGPTATLWVTSIYKNQEPEVNELIGITKDTMTLTPNDMNHPHIQTVMNSIRYVELFGSWGSDLTREQYIGNLAFNVFSSVSSHPHGLTLVVMDQIDDAQEIYQQLKSTFNYDNDMDVILYHPQFRVSEHRALEESIRERGSSPTILVTTSIIESNVPIDAYRVYTELCPWSSMVKRIGLCNRSGKYNNENPTVYWVDRMVPSSQGVSRDEMNQMFSIREQLLKWDSITMADVCNCPAPPENQPPIVPDGSDIIRLFHTEQYMNHANGKVADYIDAPEKSSILAYWRRWIKDSSLMEMTPPADTLAPPYAYELCRIAVSDFKLFLDSMSERDLCPNSWHRDPMTHEWRSLFKKELHPGLIVLLHSDAGGYSPELGWTGQPVSVEPLVYDVPELAESEDASSEPSGLKWQTIAAHTESVMEEWEMLRLRLAPSFPEIPWDDVETAVRWHDLGKAHPGFQHMLQGDGTSPDPDEVWAKSDRMLKKKVYWVEENDVRIARECFRHEVASGIAALMHGRSDLAAYLMTAHHGKVRLSLEPLLGEVIPAGNRLYSRGIWDGDSLPETRLGGGVTVPSTALSMAFAFHGDPVLGPSWDERTRKLLEDYGPFRLAFMELLVRVADWRGSAQ